MAKFSRKVQWAGKTPDALYQFLGLELDGFLAKNPWGSCKLTRDPQQLKIAAESRFFQAELQCLPDVRLPADGGGASPAGAILDLHLQLTWMAEPFKKQIEAGFHDWLEKAMKKA